MNTQPSPDPRPSESADAWAVPDDDPAVLGAERRRRRQVALLTGVASVSAGLACLATFIGLWVSFWGPLVRTGDSRSLLVAAVHPWLILVPSFLVALLVVGRTRWTWLFALACGAMVVGPVLAFMRVT